MASRLTQEDVDRAVRIARWYGRRTGRTELADLESAALEGLTKAARDWNPQRAKRRHRSANARPFWNFACARIIGEMRDELRRLDHLTRNQRALITEDLTGELTLDDESLRWINPQKPLPLDASIEIDESGNGCAIVDLVEESHSSIEDFELRDAFLRAGAYLPDRQRFVVVKRELEGYSNSEIAEAFDVTEGRASQLRGAALEQMREHIGDSFVDAA